MSLLKCVECGGMVSSKAAACPHCGCPVEATENSPNVNVFVLSNTSYDISEVIDCLEKEKLTMAHVCIGSIFNNCSYEECKQLEVDIWNQFKAYKERQTPNLCEPSPILSYEYDGKICDVTRMVWWLERRDWQKAFIEVYFAFPYGKVKNGQEEQLRLKKITDGIQAQLDAYKQAGNTVVYPRWFTEWKEKNNAQAANKPKCPTCGSTNIESINAVTRGAALGLFGLASKTARSQFRCKSCGYKW